jgi:hypothetical protein
LISRHENSSIQVQHEFSFLWAKASKEQQVWANVPCLVNGASEAVALLALRRLVLPVLVLPIVVLDTYPGCSFRHIDRPRAPRNFTMRVKPLLQMLTIPSTHQYRGYCVPRHDLSNRLIDISKNQAEFVMENHAIVDILKLDGQNLVTP